MRKEFSIFVKSYLAENTSSIVLLGDISVGLFVNKLGDLPDRVINLGIAEQSMISFAAGISREGILPFVHTISPFIIERAFEQIKLDLSYNQNKCVLVSANGPYDYNKLGPTHHCAGDIPLIYTLPHMEYALPGKVSDVAPVLTWAISRKMPTYVRLSSFSNDYADLEAGRIKANGKNSARLDIFVGESLLQYNAEIQSNIGSALYVWNRYQISEVGLRGYKEVHIWEPYSLGILSFELCEHVDLDARIYSHTYPKSIESGIYAKPYFDERRVR